MLYIGSSLALATASLLWLSTASNVGKGHAPIALRDYRQTFDEPFDRLDVSAWGPGTRWIAHTPWNGDFGSAGFADPRPDGPFSVANGLLTITMRRRPDGHWESGLLASADRSGRGFTQKTGYFEMRAKFPSGKGVWPAFWLSMIGRLGVASAEIDVVEHYGHDPATYLATGHVWKDGAQLSEQHVTVHVPAGSLSAGFHTYGVSVEASGVDFYLDRKWVGALPPKPEYLLPKFILLDLGAGGGWPIEDMPDPSIMQIDYVRAYTRRR